ncbi:MAG: sulfotransferase [Gallionellaceae bacterium]
MRNSLPARMLDHVPDAMVNYVANAYLRRKFSAAPIFIGGAPRSGTSLLLSLLGSHPHIHAIEYETTSFHPRQKLERLFAAIFFEDHARHRRHIDRDKTRFAEKTPGNVRHVAEINAFFNAQVVFINIVRDGRDVVTSYHPSRPGEYFVPIERWVEDIRFGLDAQQLNNVYMLKYEDLVASPVHAIQGICEFLGEPYLPKMLEYQKYTNVKDISAWQGGAKPIHTGSLCKWRNPKHAERIREFYKNADAVALTRQLGYPE